MRRPLSLPRASSEDALAEDDTPWEVGGMKEEKWEVREVRADVFEPAAAEAMPALGGFPAFPELEDDRGVASFELECYDNHGARHAKQSADCCCCTSRRSRVVTAAVMWVIGTVVSLIGIAWMMSETRWDTAVVGAISPMPPPLPPGAALKALDLDAPFANFTIQCSHNTFLPGQQLPLVFVAGRAAPPTPTAITNALNLNYRCVELDIYGRKNPRVVEDAWEGPAAQNGTEPAPAQKSYVKVRHTALPWVMHSAEFSAFIRAIYEWLLQDEQRGRASEATPKLPLVISVQNELSTKQQERYAASILSLLDAGGPPRIVRTGEFRVGATLREFSATGGRGPGSYRRRIILKGKSTNSDGLVIDRELAELFAMGMVGRKNFADKPTPPALGDAMHAVSFPDDLAWEDVMVSVIRSKYLVRVYPSSSAMNTDSRNYDPLPYLRAGAQMVCVNVQGTCGVRAACGCPVHGVQPMPEEMPTAGGCMCHCAREVAAPLERAFTRFGYDGYMQVSRLGRNDWAELEDLLVLPS